MAIIGLLAGYVAPRYFAQIGKSEIKLARAQIDALDKLLDQFRLDVGHYHYPLMDDGLETLKKPNFSFNYASFDNKTKYADSALMCGALRYSSRPSMKP